MRDELDPDKNPGLGLQPVYIAGCSFKQGNVQYQYGDIVPVGIAERNLGSVTELKIPNESFNKLPTAAREAYLNRRQGRGVRVEARVINGDTNG